MGMGGDLRRDGTALARFGGVILFVYVFSNAFFNCSTVLKSQWAVLSGGLSTALECAMLAFCFASLMLRGRSLRPFSALCALGACVLALSGMRTGDWRPLTGIAVLLACGDKDPKEICKAYFVACSAAVATVVFLAVVGRISNKDFIPNGWLVFSYGFFHPNTLGVLLFSCCGSLTYAQWDRGWRFATALSILSALFSKVIISANAAAVLCGAIAAANIVAHLAPAMGLPCGWKASRCVYERSLVGTPIVLLLAVMVSCLAYDQFGFLAGLLDRFTHSRIRFAHAYALEKGGATLFGRPYSTTDDYHTGQGFGAVDGGYCYLVLVYGLAVTIVLVLFYILCVRRLSRRERHPFTWVSLLLFCTYMLVEAVPLFPYMNYALFLLVAAGDGSESKARVGDSGGVPRGRE